MNELQSLLLIVAALYVAESLFWVRRDAVVFQAWWGRRPRAVPARVLPGNAEFGLGLGNPLPPLGTVYVSQYWPVSLSPEGVYSYVAHAHNPGERPEQEEQYVRFADLQKVGADGRKIIINGKLFVRASTARLARHIAGLLRQLAARPADERERLIQANLSETLSLDRAQASVQAWRAQSLPLRLSCNVLFLYVFALIPLVIWFQGLERAWLRLLIGLLGIWVLTMLEYHWTYKALLPEEKRDRWRHFVMMALTPLAAIRACDAVTRDLLALAHPLAAAGALCGPPVFMDFARRVLLDARHPIAPACPTSEPGPAETERWFRAKWNTLLGEALRRMGIDPERPVSPPAREDETTQAYCPRCEGQYVVAEGECGICRLPLRRFE